MTDYLLAQSSVLGAMLISPEITGEVLTLLKPEDFDEGLGRDIFLAVRDMFLDGEKIDPTLVLGKLGGPDPRKREYILELMDVTPTANNFREYAAIARRESKRRSLRELGELLAEAPDLDAAAELVGKPTNADRIRAMSDEELAAWIFLPDGKAEQYETCITILMEKVFDIPYDKQSDPLHDVLRWLQQPAPEEGEQND